MRFANQDENEWTVSANWRCYGRIRVGPSGEFEFFVETSHFNLSGTQLNEIVAFCRKQTRERL